MTDTFDSIRDHLSAAYRELDALAPDVDGDGRETLRECRDSLSRVMARVAAVGVLHRARLQETAYAGGTADE